ncbi:MAG: acyl carrier protein [Nanoarchaeota archaeon]
MSLEDELRDIISKESKIDKDKIKLESVLLAKDGLNLDSLDTVEVIMKIEDIYKISIPNGTAQDFKTFGEVVNYVRSQLPENYDKEQ